MNKRWIAILLASCMLFGLLGCRTTGTPEDTSTPDSQLSATEDNGVVITPDNGPQNLDTAPTVETVVDATASTDPTVNTTPATEPTEITTPPTEPDSTEDPTTPSTDDSNSSITDYEAYHNMSGEEQKAFIDSFESIEAFFVWYNAAKAEYEAQNPGIDVGDGEIDLGGGNG